VLDVRVKKVVSSDKDIKLVLDVRLKSVLVVNVVLKYETLTVYAGVAGFVVSEESGGLFEGSEELVGA
jgi:hypothetical protein